jgi:hypothetical protein
MAEPTDVTPSPAPADARSDQASLSREFLDDVYSLSSEEAGEILEARAADFRPQAPLTASTPKEASMVLARRSSDPEWARKLTNGDIATREEFQQLCALQASADVGDAMADQMFEVTVGPGLGGPQLSRRDMLSAAADLRADGLNEEAIYHILNDGKFAVEAVRDAQFWLPRMERDPTLLSPDLPQDREYQLKVWRIIAAIGTGDGP